MKLFEFILRATATVGIFSLFALFFMFGYLPEKIMNLIHIQLRSNRHSSRLNIAFRLLKAAGRMLLTGRTLLRMRRAAAAVSIFILATFFVCAQGTLNFNNKVSFADIDAPVLNVDGVSRLEGPGYFARLYFTATNAPAGLQPVGAVVDFRTGVAAGYVNVGAEGSRTIPGVNFGETGIFQIRAWESLYGDTYEIASLNPLARVGESPSIQVMLGASQLNPPANMAGLQSFQLHAVPEPAMWQLLSLAVIFGTSCLLLRRK